MIIHYCTSDDDDDDDDVPTLVTDDSDDDWDVGWRFEQNPEEVEQNPEEVLFTNWLILHLSSLILLSILSISTAF